MRDFNQTTRRLLVLILSIMIVMFSILGSFSFTDKEARVIRVAGDINYPPYEFMDENGVYRGYNVDMLGAVFLELEMPFELIPMKWEDAQKALLTGEVDMIQGMTKTFERESHYLFAEPLIVNSQAIFVREDNTFIFQLSDLNNRIATYQEGDVAEEILSKQPLTEAAGFTDQEQALLEVLDGRADAFVGNRLTAIYYLQKMKRLDEMKIIGEPMYVTNYGMAVRMDDLELLNTLNDGIRRVKVDGIYERINKKWFGEQLTDYGMTLNQVRKIIYLLLMFMLIAIAVALVIRQWNEKLSREVVLQTEHIQEQEAALRQYEKMQAVGNLVAGIAHELRNPLTAIKTFSELVPLKRDNDHFIEEFERIVPSEITRMDQLISGLLDYARPKHSEPKLVNLSAMLDDIRLLLRNRFEVQEITFEIKLKTPMVFADPYQLKQILLNLIINSLDAMEIVSEEENDQTRLISVSSQSEGERTILTLLDNGPGMSPEDVSHIYEPFFSSKRGGHGLGLPIVEQLIRENDGTIELSSKIGMGTVVKIDLPGGLKESKRI